MLQFYLLNSFFVEIFRIKNPKILNYINYSPPKCWRCPCILVLIYMSSSSRSVWVKAYGSSPKNSIDLFFNPSLISKIFYFFQVVSLRWRINIKFFCLDIKLKSKALAMIHYNSKIEYNFGDGSYFPTFLVTDHTLVMHATIMEYWKLLFCVSRSKWCIGFSFNRPVRFILPWSQPQKS